MNWLNNTMSLGASTPSYDLGSPLVVGDIGNAQYAQPTQGGFNWGGLLGAGAQGLSAYSKAQKNQPQLPSASPVGSLQFAGRYKNPGASAFSGLLTSNANRGGM
ncbi:hypothetical protein SXHG_00121 [Synechococcus phage MRHenn-2013a]|nr:hypothetical protein SXHG_00121 [Synechococcus phage MRHenn-2013a]